MSLKSDNSKKSAYGKLIPDFGEFYEFINMNWKMEPKMSIVSLGCDEELGFGVFCVEGHVEYQVLLQIGKNDKLLDSSIQNEWEKGAMITACAARGSTFYIVMTKDAKLISKNSGQICRITGSWDLTVSYIKDNYRKKNYILTGLCYSIKMAKYFIVLTKRLSIRQELKLFKASDGLKIRQKWLKEKYKQGLSPSLLFVDPTNDKTLIVATKQEGKKDYICKFSYELS